MVHIRQEREYQEIDIPDNWDINNLTCDQYDHLYTLMNKIDEHVINEWTDDMNIVNIIAEAPHG